MPAIRALQRCVSAAAPDRIAAAGCKRLLDRRRGIDAREDFLVQRGSEFGLGQEHGVLRAQNRDGRISRAADGHLAPAVSTSLVRCGGIVDRGRLHLDFESQFDVTRGLAASNAPVLSRNLPKENLDVIRRDAHRFQVPNDRRIQ